MSRSTKVRLEVDVTAFIADMKMAGKVTANVAQESASAAKTAAAVQKKVQAEQAAATRAAAKAAKAAAAEQEKAAKRGRDALDEVAQVASRGAIAVGAGLALSAKAAVDWESSWAGVAKTVSGSDAELAALEDSLRSMAKTLPASHDEIAAVAEAAGQLGIKTSDVAGFTETMIKLGETTNLTADEAATSIAQISNVMGTMDRLGTDGVDRFAAALVHLGNNGASTERDIVSMASRIAGAAKVVGISEADLLAVSNALSSVGIKAEAGGTAFSNVLIDMSKAVKTGNADLTRFAEVAGMSSAEFSSAFRERPAAAIDAFVQGLGRIQASGGDVFTTLSDLGQADVRVSTALLKMAGAGDLLTQSLDDGTRAWEQNSALQNEFAKRAETTAAKMQVARSNIRDAAITIGDSLLPMLSAVATGAAKTAEAIASIPAPIRNTGLAVAGLGSAGILAAAGVAKVVDISKKAGEAFTYISSKGPKAEAAMTRAGKAAAIAGKAFLGLTVAGAAVAAFADDAQKLGSEQLIRGLDESSDAVAAINAELQRVQAGDLGQFNAGVHDLGDALRYAFDPSVGSKADNVLGSVFGAFGSDNVSDINEATARLADLDAVMADLVGRGSADKAAAMMSAIGDEAARQGVSVERLAAKFPAYQEALAGAANAAADAGQNSAGAAGGVDELGDSVDEAAKVAEGARQAIDDLAESFSNLGSELLGQRGSARDFQEAIDAASEAVEENGRTLKITSEAGRENQAALDAIAESTASWAAAAVEAGASQDKVAGIMRSGRKAFIDAATDMGMSALQAGLLADKLGLIPKDVKTEFEAAGVTEATTQTETYTTAVGNVPDWARTTFETPGSDAAQGEAVDMKAKVDNVPARARTTFETPGSGAAQWEALMTKRRIEDIPTVWSTSIAVSGAIAAAAAARSVATAILSIPTSRSTVVSRKTITINEDGGLYDYGRGGNVTAYEGGGVALGTGAHVPRVSQILSGTGGILWQEPATGWEAYISGKPGMESRNLRVWAEAGQRLGIPPWLLEMARARKNFADGGSVSHLPEPAPAGGGSLRVAPADLAAAFRAAIVGLGITVDAEQIGRVVDRRGRRMVGI